MAYLLDANVFIQAKNLHYGFDFCPGFWEWLKDANTRGLVHSIEKVKDELEAGDDDLSRWAKDAAPSFFLPIAASDLNSMGAVSAWTLAESRYEQSARTIFLSGADYYLIAVAHAQQHVIVTHEVSAPNSRTKIKIPDVCLGMGVKFMTPYTMLRREHALFVLKQ